MPLTASKVANAEALLSADVIALGLLRGAVLEVLGFARLRLAEGLVGDEDTAATIACNPGESPTLHLMTFLVVGVLVAVRHLGVVGTIGVFDTSANRAGMTPS